MRRSVLKKILPVMGAAALLWLLAACGGQSLGAPKDELLQKVLDAGELILGLDTEFPPMGFIDGTGEAVGFDIDVAQEVCDRLGIRLVKQSIDWEKKEEELNSGRIDCIWNGLSVTPGRAETMCLSDPYMKNELIFVILGSSDAKVLRDLSGRRVGVQAGSTAQEALLDSELYPEIRVTVYDTVGTLVDRLNRKEVDAALLDSVSAYYYVFSSDDPYFILSESLGEEAHGGGCALAPRAL